jgi:hypothetical protein
LYRLEAAFRVFNFVIEYLLLDLYVGPFFGVIGLVVGIGF